MPDLKKNVAFVCHLCTELCKITSHLTLYFYYSSDFNLFSQHELGTAGDKVFRICTDRWCSKEHLIWFRT